MPELMVTGLGVTAAIGQGKADFISALLAGRHAFDVMKRPGRQRESAFLGAELSPLSYPESFPKGVLRTASFSAQVAMLTLHEAWQEANLKDVDPFRIGLLIGGSNIQQRELVNTYESYKDRVQFVRPSYGFSFMDSDLCGLGTELFGIRGFAYTVGGASASGQLAILQACQAIQLGQVDVCIAVGALMDLSYWECQALRSLGAMGSDRFADEPAMASRPFDKNRDGFIYGESCGVIVIERADAVARSGLHPYAQISGWAMEMDANRHPNPSYEGEKRSITNALKQAGLLAAEIDYINPHGTGSMIGDEIELKAIRDSGLSSAYINASKSIIGHGMSAAGNVEVIATLLQMDASQLHPSINLEQPIDPDFNWVRQQSQDHVIKHALNLSMGFGGINTAVCLSR